MMKGHPMKALALAALVAALPAAAVAQQACFPRDEMLSRLATQYGETQVFAGIAGTGELVAVFLSAETRTWSAVVIRTDGMACMVAAGQNGEASLPTALVPGTLN